MTTITVCVLTFKRPHLLTKTLESVLKQERESDWILTVMVVDNDAEGSGYAGVEPLLNEYADQIRYVVEPDQGIARARNRALQEAQGADFICFVDDDEYALPRWLLELMRVQRMTEADVVAGPVYPEFEDAPEWAMRSKFFAPRQAPTGSAVRFIATNNIVMKGVLAVRYRFDLRFDKTSGEDTHFFERARRDGSRFVWAAGAQMVEHIPATRTTARWLLRRARSNGNRYSRVCLYMRPGLRTWLVRAAVGLGAIADGLVKFPLAIFGPEYAVHSAARIYRGIGTLSALGGKSQVYYTSAPIDTPAPR
jgi:glycosyltransferase involved in cell wall biosynthesis